MERADVLRGYTAHVLTGVTPQTIDVGQICPEGRVFAFTLDAARLGEEDGSPIAILHLQDSELRIYATRPNVDPPSGRISHDLSAARPGVKWPASAKLEVAANAVATLHVSYGGCGGGEG